jgi:polyisoprenoid-binding protein YceI
MKCNILSIGIVPLLLLGCSNPADDVPKAEVTAARANAPAVELASLEGMVFAFGPANSRIDYIGSKVTGSHDGGFHNFAGEFRVVNGRLANSGNKVVIDIHSLWSDNDRLTRHLKSPDFFDAERHPAATFTSTAIEQSENGSKVTGNLTLHGVTKQISFPADIRLSQDELTVTSEFVLDRFDFDMKYPGRADDLIRKEVVIKLNLRAVPGKADFAQFSAAAL